MPAVTAAGISNGMVTQWNQNRIHNNMGLLPGCGISAPLHKTLSRASHIVLPLTLPGK